MNIKPRSLQELRVAVNMASIALKAMQPGDERIPLAVKRLRSAKEDLRVFNYKSKTISLNGKLIRH